jgi:uroporphyrinogen decarboxylase|uniref:Uroporphyrinogen decarboxylase (URO-D) domain-containing protein n=1 Tax=candidate division WOR-3 bacterium TaxID=2052148 RepID=A0A7V3RHG9_UNCW3
MAQVKSLRLNSRDKVRAVIEHRRKFAIFPIVCADHCAYLLNKNFKDVANDGRKLAEVLEYGYRLYKYDMVLIFSDPYIEAEAMGCELEYSPYPKLISNKGRSLTNAIKIKVLRLNSRDRTKNIIKSAKILTEKLDIPIFVSIKGPFTLACFLYGTEEFLKIVISDEMRARDVIDTATNFQLEYLKKLLMIPVHIFIGDPMASASVISPKTFEKFACEPLQILIKQIKSTGMIAGVHICGDTKPIIKNLDNLNADILSIEDITLKTKTLKMGGVSTLTLLNGDKSKIKKEIESALKEDFLILSTSCDVAVHTPVENIKTMVEIARQYED